MTLADLERVHEIQDFVKILRRRLLQVIAHGSYLHTDLPDLDGMASNLAKSVLLRRLHTDASSPSPAAIGCVKNSADL